MEYTPVSPKKLRLVVWVAALGYFVDLYDILIFTVVRQSSLAGIGMPESEQLSSGVWLFNVQMVGMLLGGVLWGAWGDKHGRLSVLFGSIIMYSVANLANGFVDGLASYTLWRFIAGVGLAGELGAGITLVSELLPKERRSVGTAFVLSFGLWGAVAGALIGGYFDWRTAYFVGGAMGLVLLFLRVGVVESSVFASTRDRQHVSRGNLLILFRSPWQLLRYIAILLVGAPTWYLTGILIMFTPEISAALGMTTAPQVPAAVVTGYIGFSLGNFACGYTAQRLQSRKGSMRVFLACMTIGAAAFFLLGSRHIALYYACIALMGFGAGYNASLFTLAAEQFGTNIRASVVTSVTNFIRGFGIIWALLFKSLAPLSDAAVAALWVGIIAFVGAWLAQYILQETFRRDLDYTE